MLAERGHSVTLITLDDGSQDRHQVDSEVHRICLEVLSQNRTSSSSWSHRMTRGLMTRGLMTRGIGAIRRISRIRRAIRTVAPEVVLSFCDQMNVMTLIATKGIGVPVVACERSDPRHQKLPALWEWLRSATYSRASKVIALTGEVETHIQQTYGAATAVIASAVDIPETASERGRADNAKQILAMGRLEPEKGFDRLITAFGNLAHQFPEWTLCILGDGQERNTLLKQITNLDLADRISLPGWKKQPWEIADEATFFVLPSRYEGFPSALMEAMARGIPCLSVDCDSGPRAVIESHSEEPKQASALLVPNDKKSLEAGIERLISDSSFRESLGTNGQRAIARFGWDTMVDQYEKVLFGSSSEV